VIALAFARYLGAAGLVTLDESGPAGDCFIGELPAAPDEAVAVLPTGGLPTRAKASLGYDEPTLQLLVRGVPGDPVGPHERAAAIYGAAQGLRQVTLDAGGEHEARLIDCSSPQTAPVPVGADENGRHRYSVNLALHVRALTPHRK
jgi:hypothetical protein